MDIEQDPNSLQDKRRNEQQLERIGLQSMTLHIAIYLVPLLVFHNFDLNSPGVLTRDIHRLEQGDLRRYDYLHAVVVDILLSSQVHYDLDDD